MANEYEKSVLENMSGVEKKLTDVLSNGDEMSDRLMAQAILSIVQVGRMNIVRHDDCPALRFYTRFMNRVVPLLITCLLLALAGGFVYALRTNIQLP